MLDFSHVPQGGDGGSAALAAIPDGTLLVCELHLADKTFSDLNPTYMVRNKFHPQGLINFHYDLVVMMPADHAGKTIGGQKPVTASAQREFGLDYPGMEAETVKGDRAVAAILSFDGLARGIAPSMAMPSYDYLEGRYCAAMVSTWQGKKCLQILSPLRPKEKMTCEMLAERWRQTGQVAKTPQGRQMPQQMQPWGANTAVQSTPPAGSPQAQQMPQQIPQQIPQVQQHVQASTQYRSPQQMQHPLPPANNGWPQPSDDDIPF